MKSYLLVSANYLWTTNSQWYLEKPICTQPSRAVQMIPLDYTKNYSKDLYCKHRKFERQNFWYNLNLIIRMFNACYAQTSPSPSINNSYKYACLLCPTSTPVICLISQELRSFARKPRIIQALSFTMYYEIPQTIPMIALHINVIHAASQPTLHRLWIPSKQPHYATPT